MQIKPSESWKPETWCLSHTIRITGLRECDQDPEDVAHEIDEILCPRPRRLGGGAIRLYNKHEVRVTST